MRRILALWLCPELKNEIAGLNEQIFAYRIANVQRAARRWMEVQEFKSALHRKPVELGS